MKESCQDREEYLTKLSGLETLTDLYIRKPASRRGGLLSVLSGTALGKKLKPFANLFRRPAVPMKSPDGDLKLNKLSCRERAPLYFSNERIAVYTALFGDGDRIRNPLISPDNIQYFIITDQPLPEQSLWQKINAEDIMPKEILSDPVLCNRWCKMHPHALFPEHNVSVYLDANILVTSDLTPLTAGLGKYPVTMFRHRTRDCVYQEIRACCLQKKAPLKTLLRDRKRLKKSGLPEHLGLLEAPVIARRHHDPLCCRIMDEWWKAFCECECKRDQIALADCLWRLGIPPEQIGILGSNVRAAGMYIQLSHIPSQKH